MSKHPTDRRHGKGGGFTLLEVLTATLMFAVIMGALCSVFSAALRLRETAYGAFEKDLPKDYVIESVKRDLANIMLPTGVLASEMIGEKQEQGKSRGDHLEIHTASGILSDSNPWADVQRIEYGLEQAEATDNNQKEPVGQNLVRAITRNLLASIEDEPEKETLLQGVQSLKFTYYDGQDWLDAWDSTTQQEDMTDSSTLPQAVKMRVDFVAPASGEREQLPIEVVVPIVIKVVTPATEQSDTASGTSGSKSGTSGGTSGGKSTTSGGK